MKKLLAALFAIALFAANDVSAQKIYSTKTGQIKFFSSTPAEDIEAVNNEVDSKLSSTGQMQFTVLIKGFRFPNSLMQEHFNDDYMESAKFPRGDFKGTLSGMKEADFKKEGTYKVTATGNLTMRGISKAVSVPGTIEVKKGTIIVKAVFKVALKDFNITGSEIGKAIAKEIEITVNCQYPS